MEKEEIAASLDAIQDPVSLQEPVYNDGTENIFVMDQHRETHQDIRPIKIGLLNLMPLKEETELQILRSLSNTPLQVDVTFVAVASHQSNNTS